MERIAKFHKVSYEQFEGDWKDTFGPIETEEIKRIYEGIRLPARATAGSAGYDLLRKASGRIWRRMYSTGNLNWPCLYPIRTRCGFTGG